MAKQGVVYNFKVRRDKCRLKVISYKDPSQYLTHSTFTENRPHTGGGRDD